MRMWIVAVVLVSVEGFVVDGVIVEGRVVYAERVLPHAVVRVVGQGVVVIARTDARGHFHVGALPAGAYRVELERGAVADRAPAVYRHLVDRARDRVRRALTLQHAARCAPAPCC